jgi:hypothetical protein
MTKDNNNKNNSLDVINTKQIVSVAVIIAIAAMFVFSNAFVNPLLAKSSKSDGKTDSKSTDKKGSTATVSSNPATTTTSSSSDQNDYKNFQKCLSTAEGTKGFATNQEIKNCYNPIYRPIPTSTSTTSFSSPSNPLSSSVK